MTTHSATYDDTGAFDFTDVFNASVNDYLKLVSSAGKPYLAGSTHMPEMTMISGDRVPKQLVDMTARSGYSMIGSKPLTRYQMAAEYYQFDWEFAGAPEETSWLASSWVLPSPRCSTSPCPCLMLDRRVSTCGSGLEHPDQLH